MGGCCLKGQGKRAKSIIVRGARDGKGKAKDFYAAWQLGELLGEGTFGTVYACNPLPSFTVNLHHTDNLAKTTIFAVKVLEHGQGKWWEKMSKEQVLRWKLFAQEYEMMRSLRHPNIIRFIDMYLDQEFIYIVMEKFHADLIDMLNVLMEGSHRRRCLPDCAIGEIMHQCCSAVAHLHNQKIVHRDVKMDNFLVDGPTFKARNFRVVLTDMSMATYVADGVFLKDVTGTKRYWAPEQVECCYRHEVDVWALGVTLWCILTMTFPFDTPEETLNEELEKPEWTIISDVQYDLCLQMMDKEPQYRITAQASLEHPCISEAIHAHKDMVKNAHGLSEEEQETVYAVLDGFISAGNDLGREVMTVEDAKKRCIELIDFGVVGFCHKGPPSPCVPVEIIFKSKWNLQTGANKWTSYRCCESGDLVWMPEGIQMLKNEGLYEQFSRPKAGEIVDTVIEEHLYETGSMEGFLSFGDILCVTEVATQKPLKIGDVIKSIRKAKGNKGFKLYEGEYGYVKAQLVKDTVNLYGCAWVDDEGNQRGTTEFYTATWFDWVMRVPAVRLFDELYNDSSWSCTWDNRAFMIVDDLTCTWEEDTDGQKVRSTGTWRIAEDGTLLVIDDFGSSFWICFNDTGVNMTRPNRVKEGLEAKVNTTEGKSGFSLKFIEYRELDWQAEDKGPPKQKVDLRTGRENDSQKLAYRRASIDQKRRMSQQRISLGLSNEGGEAHSAFQDVLDKVNSSTMDIDYDDSEDDDGGGLPFAPTQTMLPGPDSMNFTGAHVISKGQGGAVTEKNHAWWSQERCVEKLVPEASTNCTTPELSTSVPDDAQPIPGDIAFVECPSVEVLEAHLMIHGIDQSQLEMGADKTIDNVYQEIKQQGCNVVVRAHGRNGKPCIERDLDARAASLGPRGSRNSDGFNILEPEGAIKAWNPVSLEEVLKNHQVDVSKFGSGSARTIADLTSEVNHCESRLLSNGQEVQRQVTVLIAKIKNRIGAYFVQGEVAFGQTEADMKGSFPSIKVMPNDNRVNAIRRLLATTDIAFSACKISFGPLRIDKKESPSYPGLTTVYIEHVVEVMLLGGNLGACSMWVTGIIKTKKMQLPARDGAVGFDPENSTVTCNDDGTKSATFKKTASKNSKFQAQGSRKSTKQGKKKQQKHNSGRPDGKADDKEKPFATQASVATSAPSSIDTGELPLGPTGTSATALTVDTGGPTLPARPQSPLPSPKPGRPPSPLPSPPV